ncbi:SAM pointed domain-containing Ets transcription factor-like [Lampris incognitus]|uniref:SAM pointed domain-containing Ets transcription factor-like n=1 Tax=Lampris incognitus TaxID=2546036 RepID=UPI0024B5CB45|nr:SAM pointed domain-containing Ets transcription factor-like [Lampris incognitus]
MGSPGCDQVGSATQLPVYISHSHTDAERNWQDGEEDIKPSRSLLGLPELSWPGVYLPYRDRLVSEDNPWLLRVSDAAGSTLSSSKSLDQCSTIHSQGPASPSELGLVEECCLEQVQTMVVGEVLKDIDTACKLLNITPEPMDWSCVHVQKWLLWTEHLYRLPQVSRLFQQLSGKDLCSMTEEDFRQCSAQCGDILYAHLDIWRSAAGMKERCLLGDSKPSGVDDSWSDVVSNYPSQPIHLWQFLRELLLRPHNYSRCIRWLNKEKGIFKIEDSAHVARLWGIRKNRPAMNYDKLSRSIRQYYKKGIIRKPDVSRRLVYQFVNPV